MKGYWLATVEANWRIIFKFADGDQKLQRDGAVELLVDGFVYDAHADLAKLFEDFVVGNGLAGHGFRVRVNLV